MSLSLLPPKIMQGHSYIISMYMTCALLILYPRIYCLDMYFYELYWLLVWIFKILTNDNCIYCLSISNPPRLLHFSCIFYTPNPRI